MSALWESSTRSLFVKTVWKDGHRHVLLKEEAEKSSRKSSTESSKPKVNSSRTTVPNAPPLRVPSVKLRLKKFKSLRIDSVRNNKARKSSKKRSISQNLERIEKIQNEVEDVRLQSQHNENKYRKITRAYTIDVEDASRNSILADNYPIGTKLLQSDDESPSLSDRVLMWLDLATQNGSCSQSIANFKRIPLTKPRVVTAGIIPVNKTYYHGFQKSNLTFQRRYQVAFEEDESITSDLEDDCYSSDESILKCNGINLDKERIGQNEEKVVLDNGKLTESSDDSKHSCCVNDKRQLHIFMPNFPQIMLEVDEISVISKCSSIVQ